MKVDRPGYFALYRFYTVGKVPRGYEDWAQLRLSPRRWTAIYALHELALFLVLSTVVVAFTGRAEWILWAAVATALMLPLSAWRYRSRARRALAPPPSHEVLKRIGESVPPRS